MKQPTSCGRELLPLSVIEAARAGDPLAVERVLWYYEGYMDKLCTRTLYDLDGSPRVRGCIYTEIQPGEILPGLRGSDAPEARGRKAAEKIPASYAVKPLNRPP